VGGSQSPSAGWSDVFDEKRFLKAIDDHKKLTEECQTLLKRTESYLDRSGPLNQLRFNVAELHKFEDFTKRITSQTSTLLLLLDPLHLRVDFDTNCTVHDIRDILLEWQNRNRKTSASESSVDQQKQIDEREQLNLQRQVRVNNQTVECAVATNPGLEIENNGKGEVYPILQLLWNPNGTIQLEITALEGQGAEAERIVPLTIELNAESTRLIPLYADPNRESNHNLRIYNGSMLVDLHFLNLEDLLRLQHAATGYVVYDEYSQGPVDVTLDFSSHEGSKKVKAFLQFWIPKRLEEGKDGGMLLGASICDVQLRRGSTAWTRRASRLSISSNLEKDTAEPVYRTLESPTAVFPPSPPYSPTITRTNSENFQPSSYPKTSPIGQAVPSKWPTKFGSFGSRRVSKVSLPGSPTDGGAIRRQSTNERGSAQARGQAHREPRRPMLVLFIHNSSPSRRGAEFSTITVEVDEKTILGANRCACNRSESECPHVTIKPSSGKHLLAQRYESHALEDWDITLPGTRKRNDYPTKELEELSTLRSVSIAFAEPGDLVGPEMKKRFAGHKCACIYKVMGDKRKCLTQRHQGNFGIIKGFIENAARDMQAELNTRQHIHVGAKRTQSGGKR
jgi:hypothetical protein